MSIVISIFLKVNLKTGKKPASGTLEADEVLVGTEVNGRIVGLAREGEAIQAGEVVAQLDDSVQVATYASDRIIAALVLDNARHTTICPPHESNSAATFLDRSPPNT